MKNKTKLTGAELNCIEIAVQHHIDELEDALADTGNKVALSPHQVAWHLNRGPGSFVLVHCIHLKQYRLYPGSRIEELFRLGLNLEPLVLGSLDACACSLREFVPVPEVYK
jgi:hypothetical protein